MFGSGSPPAPKVVLRLADTLSRVYGSGADVRAVHSFGFAIQRPGIGTTRSSPGRLVLRS